MEFRILGPLEVVQDGRQLTPVRPKQRVVLALLLLHANEVVATDELLDALWGEAPPETAPTALRGHVSALRKLLGSDTIETRPPGYVLRLRPDQLDLARFEELADEARGEVDPARKAELLRSALALFRGEPLSDFRYDAFAGTKAARISERRLAALEERFEAELALGSHVDVIPELESLVSANPQRERLRGQLMLALYRAGRQGEALHVYQEGRQELSEQLGLDPGPRTSGARAEDPQAGLLARLTRPHARPPGETRALRTKPGEGRCPCASSGAIRSRRCCLRSPPRCGGGGSRNDRAAEVGRRRRAKSRATRSGSSTSRAAGSSARCRWDRDRVQSRPEREASGSRCRTEGRSSRSIPQTRAVVDTVPVGADPSAIAVGAGSVWVTNGGSSTVSRISPATNSVVQTIDVPGGPAGIVVGRGAVWVANTFNDSVSRIDPATGKITATIPVGDQPIGLAIDDRGLWVANAASGTATRVAWGRASPRRRSMSATGRRRLPPDRTRSGSPTSSTEPLLVSTPRPMPSSGPFPSARFLPGLQWAEASSGSLTKRKAP